jgi:hypothetical protein
MRRLAKVARVAALSSMALAIGCNGDTSNNATSDAGGADASTTLYQRLGGHAGIRSAVDKIIQAELGDPQLASFFVNQVATPVPPGHPTVGQIAECLTNQLGNAAGGSEAYPTTVTDGQGSFTCRNMVAIQRPCHISGGTFDKFVMIAAGELQSLGVANADIQTVGSVLTSTKTAIVDPSAADAGEMAFDAGAGGDDGASDAPASDGALNEASVPDGGDVIVDSTLVDAGETGFDAGHE